MSDIRYSRSADARAVGKAPNYLHKWVSAETSLTDLVEFAYVQGRAIAHGLFDLEAGLIGDEKTHRVARLWLGSQLVIIDIDKAAGWTLEAVKALDYVKRHASAVIPSSSYTPENLKAHIIFELPALITDAERYRQVGLGIAANLPFVSDRSTLTITQPIYGTVYTAESLSGHVRALDDGLVWINDSPELVNPIAIVADRIASGEYTPGRLADFSGSAFDGGERDLPRRVLNHIAAAPDKQTEVTLEALDWALRGNWGELDRASRLPLLMSAYVGSNDTKVRDAFLEFSSPEWDESSLKEHLDTWWRTHKPRVGGYTVATLFHEARKNGWLQRSSVELSEFEEIYTEEVGDWLTAFPLPKRVLLKSPTGTGKTQGAIRYLKQIESLKCTPVKAVFFAPSIKLCLSLSAALDRAEVANTLYLDRSHKTKDAKTLIEANVLVTTLQTFAVKAFASGVDMTAYDLIVMDESDELLGAFVKAGIGGRLANPSHVDKLQARLGMDTLVALFEKAQQVLLLDGTATELSRFIMTAWSPKGSTGVYVNTFCRAKAKVTLFYQLSALRNDLVTQVAAGKRVVIACDTKAEANLNEALLILCEAAEKPEIIRITGDTSADHRVNEFFRDVEKGAKDYRVVIYNSAMGSGVSITDTKPDVLYLVSTYLAPRKVLQILNRYRAQTEVRAYVQARENLYTTSVAERYVQMQNVIRAEAALAGLETAEREPVAVTISDAALIVATDEYDQQRSVRDFLTQLLKDDGRQVAFYWSDEDVLEAETKQAKALIKAQKDEIRAGWRAVAPIKRGQSFPKDVTVEQAAMGLLHGTILETFPDCPEGALGMDDKEIADLALDFNKHRGLVKRWLNPDRIMRTTLDEMQNKRKETVAFRLYFARVELITLLSILWPDLEGEYDDEVLELRCKEFCAEVRKREAAYNMLAPTIHKMSEIEASDRSEREKALVYANVLLKAVGLNFKRRNGKRVKGTEQRIRTTRIEGLQRLFNYATLAKIDYQKDDLHDFNRTKFSALTRTVRRASSEFMQMSAGERREVMQTLNIIDGVSYNAAIEVVRERSFVN